MTIVVERAALLSAAEHALTAADMRATSPILGTTLISTEADFLVMRSCNFEMWSTARIPAETGPHAGGCVNAQALHRFAKAAPKGAQIAIDLDKTATMTAGPCRVDLETFAASDFPSEKATLDTGVADVDGDTFAQALAAIAKAGAREEARHYLVGVYLDGEVAVATDGNRMHICDLPLTCRPSIIPLPAVQKIVKLLAAGGRFGCDGAMWRAESGGRSLTGRCVEGGYVDWRRAGPDNETPFTAERDHLIDAIERATLGGSGPIKMDSQNGEIRVTSNGVFATARGEATAPCNGPDAISYLASQFVIDALSIMPADIQFDLDADRPFLVKPAQESLLNRRAYAMPMRGAQGL